MNPCDALPKDYGMYYDNCWMRHSTHGVGRVRIMDGDMYFETFSKVPSDPKRVNPRYLSCWWPRPGAFNIDGGGAAVYIARRAMRNMRKSAVANDHYFVKWGSPYLKDVMLTLRDGPNAVPLTEAQVMLKAGRAESVAVSRDIIIHPDNDEFNDEYTIVFRGLESGRLVRGVYEPTFSASPLTGRILRQLERSV